MQKYTLSMRIIHWVMAAVIITLLAVGLWMTGLSKEDVNHDYVYGMHKSFGMLALILVVLRVMNRFRSQIPAMPKEVTYFYDKLSAIIILLLYICMVAQPISGFLMSDFSGYPVYFFGIHVPSIVGKDEGFAKFFWVAHYYIGFAIIALLTLHVGGSLKHYVFDEVNLLKRMW